MACYPPETYTQHPPQPTKHAAAYHTVLLRHSLKHTIRLPKTPIPAIPPAETAMQPPWPGLRNRHRSAAKNNQSKKISLEPGCTSTVQCPLSLGCDAEFRRISEPPTREASGRPCRRIAAARHVLGTCRQHLCSHSALPLPRRDLQYTRQSRIASATCVHGARVTMHTYAQCVQFEQHACTL